MWAYAQFGHTPAPGLMAAVLAQTETQVAALQVGLNACGRVLDRSLWLGYSEVPLLSPKS